VSLLGSEPTPEKIVGELERMAGRAASCLTEALDALESRDIPKANQVIDAVQAIKRERDHVLREVASKKGRLAVGVAYVLESLERAAFYATDLAEIAINRAVEAPSRSAEVVETVSGAPAAAAASR
jgi:phosphate uptake regulator